MCVCVCLSDCARVGVCICAFSCDSWVCFCSFWGAGYIYDVQASVIQLHAHLQRTLACCQLEGMMLVLLPSREDVSQVCLCCRNPPCLRVWMLCACVCVCMRLFCYFCAGGSADVRGERGHLHSATNPGRRKFGVLSGGLGAQLARSEGQSGFKSADEVSSEQFRECS